MFEPFGISKPIEYGIHISGHCIHRNAFKSGYTLVLSNSVNTAFANFNLNRIKNNSQVIKYGHNLSIWPLTLLLNEVSQTRSVCIESHIH